MTLSAMLGATAALMRCHSDGFGASGSVIRREIVSGVIDDFSDARNASHSTLRLSVAVSPAITASRISSAVCTGQAANAIANGTTSIRRLWPC